MQSFSNYVKNLGDVPNHPDAPEDYDGEGYWPPHGRVKNPLYHRDAEKIWGDNERSYEPGVPWEQVPIQKLQTKDLISPQEHVEKKVLGRDPNTKEANAPIHVVKTLSGQHIIHNGNHRAVGKHGREGVVDARVFEKQTEDEED